MVPHGTIVKKGRPSSASSLFGSLNEAVAEPGACMPICKKLGIEAGGMHAFRHGRVSHMQSQMMPGDFVKNQIGHSSLRITSSYAHREHNHAREMVEKLLPCTQLEGLYSIASDAKALSGHPNPAM